MDETTVLLKTLTEANGVPGYETEVSEIIRTYLKPLGEVTQDNIGSLICKTNKTPSSPVVMLAGHMDEIGFMVKHITKEGFIRITPLGGWFDQVLLGHRVQIQTSSGLVTGVIGAKPPHLLPPEERKKVVEKKDMYIDIGARSKEQVVEAGVRVGDPIIPQSSFEVLADPKTYMAKALDDRVGTALMIQALKRMKEEKLPNKLIGVATVMEEVGVRGAQTSAEVVDPDVAIVLESDIAGDVPGISEDQSSVKLGAGPTVLLYDRRMIPNLKLRDFVLETAETENIPVQVSLIEGGGTDGGPIHLHKIGVPAVVLGVPVRHIHSHSGIMHRDDYDHALDLIVHLVKRLNAKQVKNLLP